MPQEISVLHYFPACLSVFKTFGGQNKKYKLSTIVHCKRKLSKSLVYKRRTVKNVNC